MAPLNLSHGFATAVWPTIIWNDKTIINNRGTSGRNAFSFCVLKPLVLAYQQATIYGRHEPHGKGVHAVIMFSIVRYRARTYAR